MAKTIYKPRRLQRRNMLLRNGFLPFEAQEMSKIPLDAPYLKDMIKERLSAFQEARRIRLSANAWKEVVYDIYISRGLTRKRYGRDFPDVWKYIRLQEERGKTKYPQYESPTKKKARVKKTSEEFGDKFDRGEQKYPKGASY